MTHRFDPEVVRLLRVAGWSPGRDVGAIVDRWADQLRPTDGPMPDAARSILSEFGNLSVGEPGPGINHARGQVRFYPPAARGESDDRSGPIGSVYPLGDVDAGHGFLFSASDGSVWTWTLDDVLRKQGSAIEDALERILLGKAALQTIEPGLPTDVTLADAD